MQYSIILLLLQTTFIVSFQSLYKINTNLKTSKYKLYDNIQLISQELENYDNSAKLDLIEPDDNTNILQLITNKSPMVGLPNVKDIEFIQNYKSFFIPEDYNDLLNDINNNLVSKVYIDTNYKQLVSLDVTKGELTDFTDFHITNINPYVISNIIQKTSDHHIPIYFENLTPNHVQLFQTIVSDVLQFISYAFPLFLILSIFSSIVRSSNFSNRQNIKDRNLFNPMGNNNRNPFQSIFKKEKDNYIKPNVSLNSWAGSPEVIDECKEVISYIESKDKFAIIGAEMPKGILLEGPPGTGKTLLAKAIATETNSTFISISGSEFVELFVGMGASRVRDLFEKARTSSPAIIFIDEIDAVGRQRGAGINLANDEREQTLNQLLYEMDGFNNNDGIIVIAATNRKDVLDQALLRPGRFDRIIRVPLPDKYSREKILELYTKQKNVEENISISDIAELADGFSGAQLKNLINEAAILAVRNNATVIKQENIFDAFEKLLVGLIKTNDTNYPATKQRVAIHESGHTLLTLLFKEYFDFQKASIQATYNGAGGYTIFSEKPEIKAGGLYTKDLLKKRLVIGMGGKAAEHVYYGDDFVSIGAYQDLKQANQLAKKMIGNFGMGETLEVFFNEDVSDESNPFLGRTLGVGEKYSDNTKFIMDKESLALVKEAYAEAKKLITENKNKFLKLSELLKEQKVIYKKDIEKLFR